MRLFHCGSQTPNPVWKWQASCRSHAPAHEGSASSERHGVWGLKVSGEKCSERSCCRSLSLYAAEWMKDTLLWIYNSISLQCCWTLCYGGKPWVCEHLDSICKTSQLLFHSLFRVTRRPPLSTLSKLSTDVKLIAKLQMTEIKWISH